ncbi:DUF3325 domain-containing protein [Acinetobacter qingfengensis]|uniref:Uncharacterized protein n=1 Tax=Acinetobacter qingfengensis TaxID=1262585 RepID=A0A1E7RF67_9GAMM|nr:DUF3325 domain-containing protein [Acinetobacter qingfengensis]KAA8735668.1 DUF3325 domain-containing protein [Acinetobacter qingfengensis]OEY97887.1 hypothetical protein BJI46_07400 [Acinetobacter qingfengensis]
MIQTLHILSALACIYIGMMCLNLSMDKPFKQVFQRTIRPLDCRVLRIVGWLFIVFAMMCSIAAWNISIGIAAWFGMATFVVGMLVFIQAYHLKKAWWLGWVVFAGLISMQLFKMIF